MKFTWFNLMPWPYLPDDFREKHRSVWVDIPNTLYDSTKLFADKVMPHLKDLWPEWKHDERWWIHPMDERIRPEERRPGAEKPKEDWPP